MSKNIIKERSERTIALRKEASTLDTTTAEGRSRIDAISNEIADNDTVIQAEARRIELAGQQAPKLSVTEERDLGRFDFGKLVRHMHAHARGANVGALDGIEAEMIAEGEKEARASGTPMSGLVLPRLLVRRLPGQAERRDMTATGQTSVAGDQGGMTIATEKRGLLDDFYNASILRAAGATVYEGLVGNLDLPRITAGTPGAGKAENATADETSPLTAMLSLTPKRLPAFVEISERLLAQSSVNIEQAIRMVLTNQALATMERAFFHGTGTNEAQGIVTTSGVDVTTVAGGTNGAAPTLANIVGLETAVDANNAVLGRLHYFTNGKVRGKLKTTPKATSTDSRMLLEDSSTALLNGYVPLFSNAIRSNLTKGDSSVASAIIFGNAADYAMGFWGGIQLEMVRDSANAKAGLYHLQATVYYDGGAQRPKSFAAMLDALTA